MMKKKKEIIINLQKMMHRKSERERKGKNRSEIGVRKKNRIGHRREGGGKVQEGI
jgi:hypothetical protein